MNLSLGIKAIIYARSLRPWMTACQNITLRVLLYLQAKNRSVGYPTFAKFGGGFYV